MAGREGRVKPSDAEIKAAEEAASRKLREEFGLALSRRDFDAAFEQELGRCLIQEEKPALDLADLAAEKAILRIFVRTQIDSIWPAKLVAEAAVRRELKRIRRDLDAAIRRVKAEVRSKYVRRDIRGSDFLRRSAVQWAEARAKYVFQPIYHTLDSNELYTVEMVGQFEDPNPSPRKAGRPAIDHNALDNFGLQVVRYFRTRQDSPPAEDYPTLVGLLWVVSGAYPFGYSDDSLYLQDRAIRVAGVRLKAMAKEADDEQVRTDDVAEDIPQPAPLLDTRFARRRD